MTPALNDPRQEAFAQAVARGLSLQAASKEAGYYLDSRKSARRAQLPHVAARVADLIRDRAWAGSSDPESVIASLLAMARDAAKLGSAAGMREARALLLEAFRLRRELDLGAADPEHAAGILPPALTKEEWLAAFAPPQN